MNVREWLEQIRKLDELINAKIAELGRIKAMAADITAKMPDGMPFSNTGTASDKVGNCVVRLIIAEHELEALIDRYADAKVKVLAKIEELPPDEYGVIHRRYVQGMKLKDVAENMEISVTQVWRIEKSALGKLQTNCEFFEM